MGWMRAEGVRRAVLDGGAVLNVTAGIAAFGLTGGAPGPSSPLGPDAWSATLSDVHHQRIEGLLAAAVEHDAFAVTPAQREAVRLAARDRASVDLQLERQLLEVDTRLTDARIGYRLLKGAAWSHTVYPEPSWRSSGDVDLLVASGDWYRTVDVLEANGCRRTVPELSSGFDRRFGKEATLACETGWEIDLHRTLVVGPFGLWIDLEDLFADPATILVGGREIPVLDLQRSFLHACYNAALADDPPRLLAVRDVCQMAVRDDIEADRVLTLATRWRGHAVVGRALALASEMLGVALWDRPVAVPFVGRRCSLTDRALMASYRGPARGYTSQAAAVAALGRGERAAYLRALARPQPSYLTARGWTPRRHLTNGAARLWRSRRPLTAPAGRRHRAGRIR